jgi:hypothetical protein
MLYFPHSAAEALEAKGTLTDVSWNLEFWILWLTLCKLKNQLSPEHLGSFLRRVIGTPDLLYGMFWVQLA